MRNKLTKVYSWLLNEIQKQEYEVWTVYDYFFSGIQKGKNKKHVMLRIDVDNGVHLCYDLMKELQKRDIRGSFYFLTAKDGRYNPLVSDLLPTLVEEGFEIGLHSNHYYQQTIFKKSALDLIREDVKLLKKTAKQKWLGMVFHGMSIEGTSLPWNWYIYKDIPPKDLNLTYHDGIDSPYTAPTSNLIWKPSVPLIGDYIYAPNGWNYAPYYPVYYIKQLNPGDTINVVFHPLNAFKNPQWTNKFNEQKPPKLATKNKIKNFTLSNIYAITKILQHTLKS